MHEIIKNAYERCRRVIGDNLDMLHKIAQALLDKEKISGEEFNALFKLDAPAQGDAPLSLKIIPRPRPAWKSIRSKAEKLPLRTSGPINS